MEIHYEIRACYLCNREYVRIIDNQGRSSLICSNCRSCLPLSSKKRSFIANYIGVQNNDYIKSKREQQKRYRKTLISGVMFMILFTIFIIFLWNCTPNEQEVFTYDYDLSSPITDTECEEYYGNRCRRLEQTYYLTMHRGLYRDKDIERLINENE